MADTVPITPGSGVGVATDEIASNLTGAVAKAGTITVTGTGTAFLSELSAGQVIRIPGTATEDRIIATIASDTSLTTTVAFTNTASGQTGQRVQQFQRIKLVHGADGTNAGDVATTNGLPIQGSQAAVASTAWTSATAGNTANTISVVGFSAVTVAVVATSTITGGVLTFEISPDNTNWFPVSLSPVDRYGNDLTYTLVASTSRAWTASADGFTNFRVRLSTVISGTATVTVMITPQAFPVEPMVNIGQVANTATQTNVAASASSVTILAANSSRRGASFLNLGTASLYLKIGGGTATATTANSVLIAPNVYFELPQPVYSGAITGIWSATGGSGVNITEYS